MKLGYRGLRLFMALLLCTFGSMTRAQVNVTTYHNDVSRTGANTQETILTPANVNSAQFGKLFSVAMDGAVYAQPLYLSNVSIAGGTHNVLYVATEHDSVYAIDADTGAVYSKVSMIPAGGTTVSSTTDVPCPDLVPEIGITGTPVIDPASLTIYLVAKSKVGGRIVQYLHALDVRTLAEKAGSPVLIQGSVPGNTADGNGSTIPFDAKLHNQRAALLLENGHVVIAWGSHCDVIPWHGWLMSYNATTLAQEAIYNTTTTLAPSDVNGCGGIWMSGGGPAADAAGNIYLATGNGGFNGSTDLSDSIIKLGPPAAGAFPVLDFFTPFNQANLQADDADLGSGGLVLLPPSTAGVQLLAQQSKIGTMYLLNTANLGKYCVTQTPACSNTDPQIVEEIQGASSGVWGSPAYWNGNLYWTGANDPIQAYSFNPNAAVPISRNPTSQSAQIFAYSAPTPSISANGTANGILWALDGSADDSTCDGGGANCLGLYAYDATNLSHMLYNSTQAANNRDSPGTAVKFETPIIANGKVYVGTQAAVSAYGLLSSSPTAAAPALSPAPGTYNAAQSVTLTDATPGATIYYTTNGTTPTTTSAVYSAPVQVAATTTINAIAVAPGYGNSAVTGGVYTINLQAGPVSVNLAGAANVAGIEADGVAFGGGGFDGDGNAYSATLLGKSLTWSGATFTFGAAGIANAVSSTTVALPAGNDTAVLLLAAGVNGNQLGQTFVVTYTDGTSSSFTQSLSDWNSPQNYAGESNVLAMAYRLNQSGATDPSGPYYVYGYSFAVNAAKTVKSITLPANPNVVVLAIDVAGGAVATPTAATPSATPAPGTYTAAQSVTLTDATPGAVIYYTINGTTPTTASAPYTAPIPVATTTTVKAIAVAGGYLNSAVASGTYTINLPSTAATPTLTPAPGTFSAAQTVTLADSTPGATIYYSTDGSTPTTASKLYSAPFSITTTTTVKAIAVAGGYLNSAVAAGTFTISTPVASSIGVNLAGADNVSGIVADNTPFTGGGLDSGGSSFSATLLGSSLTWAGSTFNFGAAGTVNAVSNAVIALPAAHATTINVLGTGVFGNHTSQNFVVTYTDGTISTFTQSVSDWHTPQNYAGETQVLSMPYRNTQNGVPDNNGPFYLYGYSFAVNAAKTVQSITLPATRYVVVVAVDITAAAASAPAMSPAPGAYAGAQVVGLTDATPGAAIYYTIDGSTPTTASTPYSAPITVAASTTLNAIAAASGYANSAVATGTYTITSQGPLTASAPTFIPTPGSFSGTQAVMLLDATPGAVLHYTLDGSAPTATSPTYTAPLQIAATSTINAIAMATGYQNSTVATGTYTISVTVPAATPTFTPAPGIYASAQAVTLADATPGAVIYYTTNGTTPTTASTPYTAPIQLGATATINAIAAAPGSSNSAVAGGTYTINLPVPAATPTMSPAPGSYTGTQSVTLADTTPGAAIYYTTDGSTPTTASKLYAAPLTIAATTTVNAIAVANGSLTSAVASGTYTLTAQTSNIVSVNLSASVNVTGFSADGATFTGGGLDSGGAGYSAALLGTSLTWAGSTFKFGAAGAADAVSNAVIALPAGHDTSINVLASGVFGNHTNQTFIVTYTDGTTSTFAQSVSDWHTPQNYPGETQVLSMPYRNIQNGTPDNNGPFYLYGYSFAVNGAKIVKSLTLPATRYVVVLAVDATTTAAAAPGFSPAQGSYAAPQTVTLSDATAGAAIYYTLDGSVPTVASTLYTAPILVGATTTVNAIAVGAGYVNSAVSTATYTLQATPPAAVPTLSPAPGTFTAAQSVTLGDTTPGAVIYYTTNGTTPTTASTPYTAPIPIGATTTLNAIAVAGGFLNSSVATGIYTINVPVAAAAPTLSPAAGTFNTQQTVSLSDTTPGAVIYYSLDGSTPTTNSTVYAGSLQIGATTTINSMAVANGYLNSPVTTGIYTINLQSPTPAATPAFGLAPGAYTSAQSVTLSDTTPGAVIYYSTDGSAPTTASTPYTAPLQIGATTTINAIAVAGGFLNSAMATGTYTINLQSPTPAATPAFGLAPGTYTSAQSVTLSDTTQGAVIYYSTDGSVPTTASTPYTAPLQIGATTTINAIAVAGGFLNSAMATGTYTINLPVPAATPTLSPLPGTFTAAQSVTLTDTTPGAVIYYTTNGSAPTTASTPYTAPIQIGASTTLNAIAVAGGFLNSAVATGIYTISGPVSVSLATAGNVTGFVADGTAFTGGGFDSDGNAYSAAQLGKSITWAGSTFPLGAAGAVDAISNSTLALPAGSFSSINLLGAAINGNQANQKFVVTYTDGTTTTFTQSLSDWHTSQGYAGESLVLGTTYRIVANGTSDLNGPFNVYGYSFAVNPAKTLKSITLPANRNVAFLAVAVK